MMNEDHDDAIRERAYLLWEKAGKPLGHEHHFWAQASEEIEGKSATGDASGASRSLNR